MEPSMQNTVTSDASIGMSATALAHVRKQLEQRGKGCGLRLGVKKVGCSGFAYVVDIIDEPNSEDVEFSVAQDVSVYIDKNYLTMLQGTQLDYIKQGLNAGFEFHNPNVTATCGCGESFSVK